MDRDAFRLEGGVRARVWKDRTTGLWFFDIRAAGVTHAGKRPTWEQALAQVLAAQAEAVAEQRAARM